MRYISTTGNSATDLKGAVLECTAPDGSFYLPESLPVIPKAFFNNIHEMSLREIAYAAVSSLLGNDTDMATLKRIVDSVFNFKMPLRAVGHNISVLELFHGPTMAFKDAGARFLAEFSKNFAPSATDSRRSVCICATTGNTGTAIAHAFSKHPAHDVVILFPQGALNRGQLAAIDAAGPHIHPIEVGGSIAQCKRMVTDALADADLHNSVQTICLNTPNYLRLVPQTVFFMHAYAQLKAANPRLKSFNVAVPCGCLSNLTAAVMAKRMGCPINRIVAGCNANDDFVRVLNGQLDPARVNINSRLTLARAMDSGAPTNLRRLLKLYDNNLEAMRADITAVSLSDDDIAETITAAIEAAAYVADPHTAVALGAAVQAMDCGETDPSIPMVVLATAHPAKSLQTMTAITGRAIELPLQLTCFMNTAHSRQQRIQMPPTYQALKRMLLSL